MPSIIQSVDGDLLALVSKAFLRAAMPLSLLMLGYIFTISKETKTVLCGIIFKFNSSIISSKWLVSVILVSILLVSGTQTTSIKGDKFSVVVLHPVVKSCGGCVLCFELSLILSFYVKVLQIWLIEIPGKKSDFLSC